MRSEKSEKSNEALRLNRLFMLVLQKRKVLYGLNSEKSIITGRTKKVLTRTMKKFQEKVGGMLEVPEGMIEKKYEIQFQISRIKIRIWDKVLNEPFESFARISEQRIH